MLAFTRTGSIVQAKHDREPATPLLRTQLKSPYVPKRRDQSVPGSQLARTQVPGDRMKQWLDGGLGFHLREHYVAVTMNLQRNQCNNVDESHPELSQRGHK